jgi:hypothetical protein
MNHLDEEENVGDSPHSSGDNMKVDSGVACSKFEIETEEKQNKNDCKNPLHRVTHPRNAYHSVSDSMDQDTEEISPRLNDLRHRFWYYQEKQIVLTVLLGAFILIMVLALPSSKGHSARDEIPPLPNTIYIEDSYVQYPQFNFSVESTQTTPFRLLLLGDSLIHVPCEYYKLQNILHKNILDSIHNDNRSDVTGTAFRANRAEKGELTFKLTISSLAKDGLTTKKLLALLPSFLSSPPSYDGVMLFWDSDLSLNTVQHLSLNSTKSQYSSDLNHLLSSIQSASIPWISFGGPGLLGERFTYQIEEKEALLDEYRLINQNVGRNLKLPYMNIRKGFQEMIPSNWVLDRGIVTTDGELPNQLGTEVLARYFATQFMKWYDQS